MARVEEYDTFDPRSYLAEYYESIGPENNFLIRNAAAAYEDFSPDSLQILEVGGGPTIYQLVSAVPKAKEIHFTDYSPLSIEEIKKWLRDDPTAFNWNKYIKASLAAEGSDTNTAAVRDRKEMLQAKITKVSRFDLLESNDPPAGQLNYDVISSYFATDGITKSLEGWQTVMNRLVRLIKHGGHLMIAGALGSNSWRYGNYTYPATNISESQIKISYADMKLKPVIFKTHVAENALHGYEGIFFIKAENQNQ